MPKSLILCDCAGTQQVDRAALESACGVSCSRVFTALCDGQIDRAAEAMQHGDVVIASLGPGDFFGETGLLEGRATRAGETSNLSHRDVHLSFRTFSNLFFREICKSLHILDSLKTISSGK